MFDTIADYLPKLGCTLRCCATSNDPSTRPRHECGSRSSSGFGCNVERWPPWGTGEKISLGAAFYNLCMIGLSVLVRSIIFYFHFQFHLPILCTHNVLLSEFVYSFVCKLQLDIQERIKTYFLGTREELFFEVVQSRIKDAMESTIEVNISLLLSILRRHGFGFKF